VGLLGKAVQNVVGCNINTGGDGSSIGRGEEIDGDIKWAKVRMFSKALRGFVLGIVLCTDQAGEGGKKLKDSKESVTNMVVKGGFVSF
jgi:hypothetical protein